MAPGRARDERKEHQWRRWIGEWQASGLSVRAFCQRRGLTVASFYAWRRALQRRAAEKATFVPVQVLPDAVQTQTSALEVLLPAQRENLEHFRLNANLATALHLAGELTRARETLRQFRTQLARPI